jgi:hypothetical protein
MSNRPDVTVQHGRSMAVVSGNRALELVDPAGCIRDATFADWLVPLADLPRLRAAAHTRGWRLVEHDGTPT